MAAKLYNFPLLLLADTSLFGARVTYLVLEERQNGHRLVHLGGGLATLPPVSSGCEVLLYEDLNPSTGPNHIPTGLLEFILWDWPRGESSVSHPRRTKVYLLRFDSQIPVETSLPPMYISVTSCIVVEIL